MVYFAFQYRKVKFKNKICEKFKYIMKQFISFVTKNDVFNFRINTQFKFFTFLFIIK